MDNARIQSTLTELLTRLGFAVDAITIAEEEDGMLRIDITTPDTSRLIGWRGETLNAVQTLLKAIIRSQEKMEKSPFLLLDTDGYRRMQEDKVRSVAAQKADFVRRTGNRIALQPMNPYYRRVVHMFIANDPQMQDLTTESIGEGDYRQIVLRLKNGRPVTGGSTEISEELSPVMAAQDDFGNLDV